MHESLKLFEEICSYKFFKTTPIIVFFNKKDLYEKKIVKTDLNVCFPDYKGGKNVKSASDFIRAKFIEKSKKNKQRSIFSHFTCATDTEQIRFVFNSVKHIFLQRNIGDVI